MQLIAHSVRAGWSSSPFRPTCITGTRPNLGFRPGAAETAVSAVHPGAELTWDGAQYVNPLGAEQLDRRSSAADKAAIAVAVVRDWDADTDWQFDLHGRIREIVAMVRAANDIAL